MKTPLLKDTSEWLSGEGILTVLTTIKDVPWKNVVAGQVLDDDYYGNHSGDRELSGLAEKLLNSDKELSNTALQRLANVIFAKYGDNWQRAWDALQEEYDPLHNYDGTEHYEAENTERYTKHNTGTETNQGTNTGTVGIQGTDTGTVDTQGTDTGTQRNVKDNTGTVGVSGTNTGTVADSGSKNNTGTQTNAKSNSGTQKVDKGIYGFDSSGASNSDTETRTDNLSENNTRTDNLSESNTNTRTDNLSHSETTTNNLSEDSTRTDNLAHAETRTDNLAHAETRTDNLSNSNTRTDNLTESNEGSGTKEYTLTKGGNLGVTTSQQMLESEILFRQKYNFFDSIVFPNIDDVLCAKYYTSDSCLY